MSYTAWSVVFGEQPTAAKWNQLGANDAGFKDGTNIDNDAILARHLNKSDIRSNEQSWQTMTPTTGSVTTTLGYYKDTLGIVHLKGQLNMSGTGVSFFTLPAGYRPAQYSEYPTSSAGGFGVFGIATTGVMTKLVGSNGNLDLDGVTFRAA